MYLLLILDGQCKSAFPKEQGQQLPPHLLLHLTSQPTNCIFHFFTTYALSSLLPLLCQLLSHFLWHPAGSGWAVVWTLYYRCLGATQGPPSVSWWSQSGCLLGVSILLLLFLTASSHHSGPLWVPPHQARGEMLIPGRDQSLGPGYSCCWEHWAWFSGCTGYQGAPFWFSSPFFFFF